MNATVTFLAVATLTTVAILFRRRRATLNCCDLVSRLHPFMLEGLDRFITNGDDPTPIHQLSGGTKGLWKRWQNAGILLQICQLHAETSPLSEEEIRLTIERAASLRSASLRAALWATLCAIPGARQRIASATLATVRLYYEIATETYVYLETDGVHLCASKLASVL